jgi:hypothetical protein
MTNSEVIGVGNEKSLHDLKMLYENKLHTPTKMIKCFGEDKYKRDWEILKKKALRLLDEHKF